METFRDIAAAICGVAGAGGVAVLGLFLWGKAIDRAVVLLRIKEAFLDYYWYRKQFKEWLASGKPRNSQDSE